MTEYNEKALNYVLLIEPHLSELDADTLFSFKEPPSKEKLKLKVGAYFIDNTARLLEDYVAEHFMNDDYSRDIFMKRFSNEYYMVLDDLGIPHKFYDRASRYHIITSDEKCTDKDSDDDNDNCHFGDRDDNDDCHLGGRDASGRLVPGRCDCEADSHYHNWFEILDLLIKKLSKNPIDVCDFFMIPWVCGSDYGYKPLLLPILEKIEEIC